MSLFLSPQTFVPYSLTHYFIHLPSTFDLVHLSSYGRHLSARGRFRHASPYDQSRPPTSPPHLPSVELTIQEKGSIPPERHYPD